MNIALQKLAQAGTLLLIVTTSAAFTATVLTIAVHAALTALEGGTS